MSLPGLLDKVRQESLDALLSRLAALFDGADDTLFDLSQKAPEAQQSLFFDAMRELRLKRQSILETFRSGVEADYVRLVPAAATAAKAGGSISLDSLSLLGDDELDVSVAFQAMVARARDRVSTDIDHLSQRVSKVLGRTIEGDQLPLHPARVCEHFREGSDTLPLPLKARLILYKLFERNLLEFLGDIIAAANQSLANGGVLPEIKSTRPRPLPSGAVSRDKPRPGEGKETKGEGGGGGGGPGSGGAGGGYPELPAGMMELITLARSAIASRLPAGLEGDGPIRLAELPAGAIPVMDGGKVLAGNRVVESDVPVQVVAPAELTALLTRLQQMQPPVSGEEQAADVKTDLSGLMREAEDAPRALNRVDDDVINLVSMLFDFIMEDPEVPPGVKALIGRLQIPLLKVSLLDKDFFKEEDHPARHLLNALAKSAVGWTRESDDGLLAKIDEVVHRVLAEFTDNVGLFPALVADFDHFVAERQKRLLLIEARLRDREEGQARTDVAQARVRDVVAERIGGRLLPPAALAVIQDAWQRVLYLTAVRDGTDSEVWSQRVKVLEVLVWCAQQYEKEDARMRQRGFIPRLVVSLRKGMEATGFDMARGEALLAALEPVLVAFAGGARGKTLRIVAEPVKAQVADGRPAASEAVQVVRRSEDEVVIAAGVPEPEKTPAADIDQSWLQTADRLGPGAWIEFVDQDFRVRGKVAARIRAQDKFVFVNGRGVKILEKTLEQLARDLQAGVARLVNDSALFDRALENMVRQLKEARTAA